MLKTSYCLHNMLRGVVVRADLVAALRFIEPLVGERLERARVCITIDDGVLTAASSDGEQTIAANCPALDWVAGRAVVPGRLLLDFVRRTIGDDLAIEDSPLTNELILRSGQGEIVLAALGSDAWRPPEACTGVPDTWDASTLQRLGRVLHAASRDPNRGLLRGVAFSAGWAAAADSFRLAAVRVAQDACQDAVVPVVAIEALLHMASGGDCEARFGHGRATFSTPHAVMTTTLIVGDFPDWQAALTKGPEWLVLDRKSILPALDRMTVMASKQELGTVTISPDGTGLRLECFVPDVGRQSDHVEGSSTMSTVSFKLQYLRSLVEVSSVDPIRLNLENSIKSAVLTEDDFVAILQPIRVPTF
jgi:DNA polymerase III sliding clamp (beta) subunit (PCNA family)